MNYSSLFFLLLQFTYAVSAKKKTKSVTTVIDAKWEVSPLVLEISEYLWDENPVLFWKYVDSISNLQPSLVELRSDKERYDRSLALVSPLMTPQQISLMKFALGLRLHSPRVEMFNQIALDRGIVCPIAADVAGSMICSSEKLRAAIDSAESLPANHRESVLHVDHKYPEGRNESVVILYGELGSSEFSEFHSILKNYAKAGKIQYIFRHWVKERPMKRLRLSGYGVELQMKSTEYKVQDDSAVEGSSAEESFEEDEEIEGFNFSKLKLLYPNKRKELENLKQELFDSTSELAQLKVWQFQELSLQAAQRIMSAPKEESLQIMLHIAQNFPTQARSLVRTSVDAELKNEVRYNQEAFLINLHIQPQDTALFLNGMYFNMEIQDIFTIFEYIRQELRIMEGLREIGFVEKKLLKTLVGLDLSTTGNDYALDIRDSAVMWLNDIENDKQYKRWSASLLDLLRPFARSMLRSVRKNLYNLVIIGDPTSKQVQPLIKLMQSFLIHNAPLRLGLVFAVDSTINGDENPSVAMLNAYNYIVETKDAAQAINFMTDVYESVGDKPITCDDIKYLLTYSFSDAKTEEIFGSDSDYNTGIKLSADFVSRSGFRSLPQVLLNGIPLPEKSLSSDEFEETVLAEILNQTPMFQKAIYKGELTDKDDILDYLMTRPNVMPRLNERILTSNKAHYINLSGKSTEILEDLIDSHIFYASKSVNDNKISFITNWIITDLSEPIGRSLLYNGLSQMQSSGSVRLALIVNPKKNGDCDIINLIALGMLKSLSPNTVSEHLIELLDKWNDEEEMESYKSFVAELVDYNETLNVHGRFVKEVLNLPNGRSGVLSNGRFLGPFDTDETFTLDDFNLLERFSSSSHVDKIYKTIVSNSDVSDNLTSDMLMKTVSLLASRPESKSRFEINAHSESYSVIKLDALKPDEPSFDLIAILDPLSTGAHKLTSLLSVLHKVLNADIKIFLNCVEKNSDMPLKSFYRYVLEEELKFTDEGKEAPGPMARFTNMPGTPLLTQNMLVPDNWFVESVASPHDLDNIRLDQVSTNVHSQFELEYFILDGHCFDSQTGSPPRGLQITLGTDTNPSQFDTIVMANLGYFQLKANPGAWKLQLRQGRSTELYDIVGASHEGIELSKVGPEVKVLISSFRAHTIKLKVNKKSDKSGIDLLGDDSDDMKQGLWGSITRTFSGTNEETKDPQDDVINIFSLASGHLYERFLRIMMLSVLKHTNSPVKFWFLKNYLSPTFKDFLPRMAKQYNFQYELVQYKWPRWLHQQTEKQRIIWGYKILFLDVLFPLDVKKIIFVDADQVVRTDLKELVDFDLGGAPYGYTPFCDSRREMDGFRFWKVGYWRNHLQGRKYHISALYVVDLKRFRRIAAGDRLRGQYQTLSQDRNSLSNLDQDLPNNMIHQVSIKSLPQDWLWCETWCDDASKERAKTIDLCNNPLTKEAKLTAAMRILPEWKGYDDEIKQLQLTLGDTDNEEEEHPDIAKTAHLPEHTIHSEL